MFLTLFWYKVSTQKMGVSTQKMGVSTWTIKHGTGHLHTEEKLLVAGGESEKEAFKGGLACIRKPLNPLYPL
jgi:hypothetical protein